MKTTKLNVILIISFLATYAVGGYVGNTGKNADINLLSATQSESIYSIVADDTFLAHTFISGTANEDGGDDDPGSCADPTDDLCED